MATETYSTPAVARPGGLREPRAILPGVWTGLVLAGGRSERMGRDKAMVFLAGRTLLERAVGAVRDAGGVPLILGSPREAGGLAGVRFQDEGADGGRRLGPLNALRHGLRIGGTRVVVALACDLPLVPPALLRFLAGECERHAAVVPRAAGGMRRRMRNSTRSCARWSGGSATTTSF